MKSLAGEGPGPDSQRGLPHLQFFNNSAPGVFIDGFFPAAKSFIIFSY